MKKTIGGDRLGSGKKMETDIQEYGRSTTNHSEIWRSTMSCGTLVPFVKKLALPGDTWDMKLNCDVLTHPTIGPLFGTFKVQLDVFIGAIRLYNGLLHNNPADLGLDMSRVKLPYMQFVSQQIPEDTILESFDLDNSQVNPSALPAYLGIRGFGTNDTGANEIRNIQCVPTLMYWDTVKNYYSNKQEEKLAVIHTPSGNLVDSVDLIQASAASAGVIPPNSGTTIPKQPATPALIQINQSWNFWVQWVILNGEPKPEQIMFNTSIGNISLKDLSLGTGVLVEPDRLQYVYNRNRYGNIDIYSWRYITAVEIGVGKPAIEMFPITNIDEMRNYIMMNTGDTPLLIADGLGGGANLIPYKWLTEWSGDLDIPNIMSSQEGLALKTYQSDQFNNWLNSEFIDGDNGINAVTAIAVEDDKFTVEQLIMSNKIYNMLNAIMVSGGTYYDWQQVNYGITPMLGSEIPMYMGGLSKELVFQEVVSNSGSEAQPLGTLAGKGTMGKKHKGGTVVIKVREASYIMGIVSITPRIDYSQGNDWDIYLETIDDLHTPWLDQIGFQDLLTHKMAWWSDNYVNATNTWTTPAIGKEPAWMDYRTSFNKNHGNFAIATNEMFMTLNRRYEPLYTANPDASYKASIKDATTYIDPSKFNFIFAETALDAQNFWVQISMDTEVRRVMTSRIMPNL